MPKINLGMVIYGLLAGLMASYLAFQEKIPTLHLSQYLWIVGIMWALSLILVALCFLVKYLRSSK